MPKYGQEFDRNWRDDWVPTREGKQITELELLVDIANMLSELLEKSDA